MTRIGKSLLKTVHGQLAFKRRVRVLADHLARHVDASGSVLDIGCGDGSLARAVTRIRPDLSFRGIDVLLRPEVHIPVDLFDGNTIPFPDKSFDWAILVDVLHHTGNPDRLLAEAARVARHGIVVKDHLGDGPLALSTLRLMDWVGNRGHDVRLPYNYLSRPQWSNLFSTSELSVTGWTTKLGLYPSPLSLVFERNLHFVATLRGRS